MAVKTKHSDEYTLHFCTFTCYQWLSLFELTNGYDLVYSWFDFLKTRKQADVVAYVVMPNHLHCILQLQKEKFDLSKIIGNGKRFMAYEMIKRMEGAGQEDMLQQLMQGLTKREIKKGQKHKVFEGSFDAKPIYSDHFFYQKLNYIHMNPLTGKWKLVEDFISYEHSSASFYELGIAKHFEPRHYKDL
jgi:REP element-mobilizing transposase RayT